MGGKGGEVQMPDTGPLMALAGQQRDIASQVWNRSQPLANRVFGDLETLLGGGQGGVLRTSMAPAREALELQFQAANQALTEQSPVRGGQLHAARAGLNTQRALGIGAMEADLLKNAFSTATGLATQAPGQALQGLGAAGGLLSNAAQMSAQAQQAQAQMDTQSALGKGQGLGQLGAIGLMSGLAPAVGQSGWLVNALSKNGAGAAPGAAAAAVAPTYWDMNDVMVSPWGTTFPT